MASRKDVFKLESVTAPVLGTDADGRLFYEGERVGFTRFDRSYIAMAAKAFTEGRDVALVYPSPPTHMQIPILLAVGFQVRSEPPVLFVSNRSGVRERYFNVGIGDKFAPVDIIEPEPLGDFTAPMVKTGDGQSASYITHHQPKEWDPENLDTAAIVHTSFGKKIATTLSEEFEISGFVLDFTTGLLDDQNVREAYEYHATERDIPRIMLFDSPQHPYLQELEKQNENGDADVLVWGWSGSTIEDSPADLLETVADVEVYSTDSVSPDGGSLPSPFVDSINSLENLREGVERSVVEIPHRDLEKIATKTYGRIGDFAQFPRGTPDAYSAASRGVVTNAYFLYMYFDTLLLSVEFHDSLSALDDANTWGTSDTLRGKVDQLRNQAPILDDDVPGSGPILEDVCDLFEKMIEVLIVHNIKADALVEELRTLRDENKVITVFTATRNQESLLRSFVAEKTEFGRGDELTETIHFQSLYNPHTVPEADVAIFPGVPTKSHYPTVQNGAAPEQRYLTYSWEVERLQKRLNNVVKTAEERIGPGVQNHSAEQLGLSGERLSEYVGTQEVREPTGGWDRTNDNDEDGASQSEGGSVLTRKSDLSSLSESERIGRSHTRISDDPEFELDELLPNQPTELDEGAIEAEQDYDDGIEREGIHEGRTVSDRSVEESTGGTVRALTVEFTDGSYILEEPHGLVWVLDSESGSTIQRERRAAQSLKRGDQILLIDEDSRRDVFEHVVEKIHSECRGPFQQYLMMLDLWNTGLDQVVDFFREMEEAMNQDPNTMNIDLSLRNIAELIAEDLTEYSEEHEIPAADREPFSVLQWLERRTIGPSSPTPIRALGELYDVEVLESHSQEIDAGLKEIRTLHQQVGHKLEKIIFSTQTADADEWILEECGLRVGDIQSATVVERVDSVETELREVQRSEVGKLKKN